MSINNILNKIFDDTNKETSSIIDSAKEQATQILAKAEQNALELRMNLIENAKQLADEEHKRMLTLEGLELRKRILHEKRSAIDIVFETAQKEIQNIDDIKYAELMKGLLIKFASSQNGTILVSNRRKNIWENIINSLKDKQNLKINLTDNADFDGFILKSSNIEIDCSTKTLLKSLKDDLETKTAEILFKGIDA